jgi:hypothetical protein
MGRGEAEHEQWIKLQTIDSAALAGAATAAALTVFSAPGPYVPMNAVIGLTLLAILLTYELRRYRSHWQNFAFGAVCALCTLLILGFLLEWGISGWNLNYYEELENRNPPDSEVNYWHMFISWGILTIMFTCLGFRNAISVQRKLADQFASEPPDVPQSKYL